MSDNLAPEVVQQELEARFRIPTEVWTDVFKLLPRRVLVQQIAPTCYYFKEISNKNVKTIHVIEKADQFTRKLKEDDLEANQQLENLAANECQLANQFRLTFFWIGEKSQIILRECPDLFDGCKIGLFINGENKGSELFLECLAELEKAKPVVISASHHVDQVIDYWNHRTFLNCSRVRLSFWSGMSDATMKNIIDWLHHQPNGVDCDGSADQQVRSMIVWHTGTRQDHIDWLVNRCSEEIQQDREPINRRPYVLSFMHLFSDWPGFDQFRRIENNLTGEMLLLDRVLDENGEPTRQFRLRRCLVEEESNGREFYAGLFKRDRGCEEFNTDEKTPKVIIEWD